MGGLDGVDDEVVDITEVCLNGLQFLDKVLAVHHGDSRVFGRLFLFGLGVWDILGAPGIDILVALSGGGALFEFV